MGYICTKQLNFSGDVYMPGEAIPDGVVEEKRARTLLANGWIVSSEGGSSTAAHTAPNRPVSDETNITIPLESPNGVIEASVSVPTLVEALVVLQKNAKTAMELVGEIEDDDVLMLIDALDSRKTVLEAVKARHNALEAGESESPTDEAKPEGKKSKS